MHTGGGALANSSTAHVNAAGAAAGSALLLGALATGAHLLRTRRTPGTHTS
jgi:hypothetical protein